MLRVQTQEYIKSLSDADLIEYVREGIYEPEAILFAQIEITQRKLEPEKIEQLVQAADHHVQERNTEAADAALLPLGRKGRIIAFLCGYCAAIGIPSLLASSRFDDLGQYRKKKELWLFNFYGFGTLALGIFVSLLLHAGSAMGLWLCFCIIGVGWIILFPPTTKEQSNICSACGGDLGDPSQACPQCRTMPAKDQIKN